jgi:hypothetical protein
MLRSSLQAAGILVTELNLPTAAWIQNFIDTNEGCAYCCGTLAFNDGSFAYQIDAVHPHARGGPGYTKENMVPVSCFAFTLFLLLLTHSLLSFQCCTFCNRAKANDTLEAFMGYTRVAFATTSTKRAASVANRPAPSPRARTPWLLIEEF